MNLQRAASLHSTRCIGKSVRVVPCAPLASCAPRSCAFRRSWRVASAQGDDALGVQSIISEPVDAEYDQQSSPIQPAAADISPDFLGTVDDSSFDSFELTAADIKAALLDSLYGTERGLTARSEVRAEINELISQLEAKNPTPNPTEAMDKLNGEWRLVYTSNSELMAILALGRLPMVTVGDIVQRIDAITMTVENQVNLTGPMSRTALTTTSTFEVRSPKRLQLKLERGQVSTPELTSDLDLPSAITVLGQSIDLTQLKQALAPLNESMQGIVSQLNTLLSQAPALSLPIQQLPMQNNQSQTWQLNTYADDDTRITRGDGGSVFIYSKVTPF